ncbi:MAG: histone-like nucleoid-structuring protein Lsr2 [Actinomycetes bacterium]
MAKKAPVGEVRAWAKEQGFELGDRGRLPAEVWEAWEARTTRGPVPQPRAEGVAAGATKDDLAAANSRIHQLEQQVAELADRLAKVESRPAEPRRLFARAR